LFIYESRWRWDELIPFLIKKKEEEEQQQQTEKGLTKLIIY
jgi:hypothetical protein